MTWIGVLAVMTVEEAPLQQTAAQAAEIGGEALPIVMGEVRPAQLQLQPHVVVADDVAGEPQDAANLQLPAATAAGEVHAALTAELEGPLQTQSAGATQPGGSTSPLDMLVQVACNAILDDTLDMLEHDAYSAVQLEGALVAALAERLETTQAA